MAIPKIIGAQRDFSAGELDHSVRRADENPTMKAGARQMRNWRILSSRALQNRSGRSALFPEAGRVERITMAPGQDFYLVFGTGYLRVYNVAGTQVFSSSLRGDGSAIPFSALQQITYAIAAKSIYIFYADGAPNNIPQILTWDGVSQTSTWTLTNFAETITNGAQKRTLFYRISPQNVTMLPSGTLGTVNITFSQPGILVSGMIGTRLTWAGRELTIVSVTDSSHGTATVNEALPPAQQLGLSNTVGSFVPGDVVIGSISGATGIVATSPDHQQLAFLHNILGTFFVGNAVAGGTSGATGVITSNGYYAGPPYDTTYYNVSLSTATLFVNNELVTCAATGQSATTETSGGASAGNFVVQLLPKSGGAIATFTTSDLVVGPSGSASITSVTTVAPQPIGVWADEVMNKFRGYPSSVFYDQGRLGLCNFPAVPSGLAWSAIGLPLDFYVNAEAGNVLPSTAIFEIVPGKSQVLYVSAGMESSEFVFCDNAIYYIKIDPVVPLEPGSVAFNQLAAFGILPNVQPRRSEQSIIFIRAGGGQVGAVQAPGAYYRPYIVDSISELHSHLFLPEQAALAVAIAIPSASLQFEELYIYILLADGTLVVGKYAMRQGLIEPGPEGKPHVGWMPWDSAATVNWIAAHQDEVTMTSFYGGGGTSIVEKLDDDQFLDGTVTVNALPAPFTPPVGKGPMFKLFGIGNVFGVTNTVFLIDQGTRFMGTYNIDANGFIVPQFIAGEDLTSRQLVAGQNWKATLEVWAPDAPPGQGNKQRMIKRRVSHFSVYVSNSSGFVMSRRWPGRVTPAQPFDDQIVSSRRVATWSIGEDPTKPPLLRAETQRWRPLGRSFDPRIVIVKDTVGPLLIHEVGMEVTI
jgi:hypothetical protein